MRHGFDDFGKTLAMKTNSGRYHFIVPAMMFFAVLALGFVCPVRAATISWPNGQTLSQAIFGLKAGDELVVTNGTHTMANLVISGIGNADGAQIVVRAEEQAKLVFSASGSNLIEFRGVHNLLFKGFDITSTYQGDTALDGIKFTGASSSQVTLEDLYIHDITGVGINIQNVNVDRVTLKNSHISHCGGSGLYWGYFNRSVVSNGAIENNYIHHCPKNAGQETHYGIQLKGGCYGMRIENNVLHDVSGTARAAIFVYYGKTLGQGDSPADMNIVRGNAILSSRAEGITACADALVENNIVFDARYGIHTQTYNEEGGAGRSFTENLIVRNNTCFRNRSYDLYLEGLGSTGSNVAVYGNALYASSSSGHAVCGSLGTAQAFGNVYFGRSDISSGFSLGTGLSDFIAVTANGQVPDLDFYPSATSAILNISALQSQHAPLDFNGNQRPYNQMCDSGAYEWSGVVNPGWRLSKNFKTGGSSSPTLNLISPNGGEAWRRGEQQVIAWTSSGLSGTLTIELLRGSTVFGTIASGVAVSACSYTWTVGTLQSGAPVSGSDLKIRITAQNGATSVLKLACGEDI